MPLLHVGGTSTASIVVSIGVIFFLIFALSFAVGPIPEGAHRIGPTWAKAWFRASLPRLIVAGVFSGLLLVGALAGGDQSTTATAASCDRDVPPLTGQALTDARLLGAIDGMRRLGDAAEQRDIAGVQALFLGDAHKFTHDIDAALRPVDEGLAKDLCLSVVVIENQMAGPLDTDVIAREADRVADYIQEARPVLDLSTDIKPSASTGSFCEQPVGAATTITLSSERLTAAAESLREMASKLEAGLEAEAYALFGGDSHNVTHDIDAPLRAADEPLAVRLCENIVGVETRFGEVYSVDERVEAARAAADDIEAGGQALGILP